MFASCYFLLQMALCILSKGRCSFFFFLKLKKCCVDKNEIKSEGEGGRALSGFSVNVSAAGSSAFLILWRWKERREGNGKGNGRPTETRAFVISGVSDFEKRAINAR